MSPFRVSPFRVPGGLGDTTLREEQTSVLKSKILPNGCFRRCTGPQTPDPLDGPTPLDGLHHG
jgi:hypothetical protein